MVLDKKNIDYAIIVTIEDEGDVIQGLTSEIGQNGFSYTLITIGSDDEIAVLGERFENTTSLADIYDECVVGAVISLSSEGLLEVGSFLEQIGRLSLWSDPRSKPDSATKLIENIFNQSLVSNIGPSITARTASGSASWGRLAPHAPESVAGCFKIESSSTKPLIDKKNIPRVLVDGRREHTNLHLVDAFMHLQDMNVEVWCAFDGDLKSWMKPDFHIKNIPLEESALYCNAVDCVILCGEGITRQDILVYFSCGIVPIPYSSSATETLSEVTNCSMFEVEGQNIKALLDRVIHDSDYRGEVYQQGKNGLNEESYFALNSVTKNSVDKELISRLYCSDEYQLFKQQYFLDKYSNTTGSSSLGRFMQSRSTLQTISPTGVSIVNYSGWCIDLTSDSSCSPIPLTADITSLADIEYSERNDVLEHFGRSTHTLPGFEASFVSLDSDLVESEVEIIFINEKNRYGLVESSDVDAMELAEKESLANKYGQFDENIRCRIEKLSVVSRCAFKISLKGEAATDLLFGIKSANESVIIDTISFTCLSDGENFSELCEFIDPNTFILKPSEQIDLMGSSELVVILDLDYPCADLELMVSRRADVNEMNGIRSGKTVSIESIDGIIANR